MRDHHVNRLLEFAEDVAAQTLGTVIGAGVLYVLAGWLGMLQPPSPRAIAAIVVLTVVPLSAVVLPRRRSRRRSRRAPAVTGGPTHGLDRAA